MDDTQARIQIAHFRKLRIQVTKQESSHIMTHRAEKITSNIDQRFSAPDRQPIQWIQAGNWS